MGVTQLMQTTGIPYATYDAIVTRPSVLDIRTMGNNAGREYSRNRKSGRYRMILECR